jgi:2-dehydro-3-deoxyphosphogluconate aldolase / (4S)-4-hydroxy-2-oxoglutarate aldolase
MTQNNIAEVLKQHQVIPVATIKDERDLFEQLEKIGKAGIKCIEVTLRTDFAFEALQIINRQKSSDFTVGVGTITNVAQINAVKEIGVDFLVSPGLTENLAKSLIESKIAFIPGVSTVSEIMAGMEFGLTHFKFFPAHLSGGIEALKAYGQLFPHLRFCPTGGISENTYQDYLALPQVISVGGSWMLKS